MKSYRLLLLTASTADGRELEVEAMSAWARELYGDKIDVKVLQPLESSPLGYMAVDMTNKIQRDWPAAHRMAFSFTELLAGMQGKQLWGQREFESTLHMFRPQMIVSFHPFLSRGYFRRAKQILGEDVRCVTYCREWSPGAGLSRHWMSNEADRWIGRSEKVVREAFRAGVSPDKLENLAFLVPPVTSKPFTRKSLRLEEDKLTLMFSNSRAGHINHLPLLQALAPFKNRVQAIVVCGFNERLRRSIVQWQKKSGLTMILEGTPHRQMDYVGVSDVVVSRGDADVAALAFAQAVPLWFDASRGMMLEEELTAKFFQDAGVGFSFASPAGLAQRVEDALQLPAQLAAARLQMAQLHEKYLGPGIRASIERLFAWGFFKARLEQLGDSGRVR